MTCGSQCALLKHGPDHIYIAGGYAPSQDAANADFGVYDSKTNVYTALAPLPEPRANMSMVHLGNHIFLVGGQTSLKNKESCVETVFAYDLTAKTWSKKADMNKPRSDAILIVAG
jgi:hypothetical protein